MNPVEAGYCAAPEEYPWSSHSATLRGPALPFLDTTRLFQLFDAGGDPRRRYEELVR